MRGFVAIPTLAILSGLSMVLKATPARAGRVSGQIDVLTDQVEDWWLAPEG